MAIRIIGAGMAGLLAANMLRKYDPVIYEAKDELPDNHGALLRFRSTDVADATGQRFKKVLVRKGIAGGERPTIDLCNSYSYKVTGAIGDRSIWNIDPVERYIAPNNFMEILAKGCFINFTYPIKSEKDIWRWSADGDPIISTMPMPVLMKILNWGDIPEFNYKTIWSYRYRLLMNIDVYQTIYYPYDSVAYYRATITGNILTIESIANIPFQNDEIQSILVNDFGLPYNVETELISENKEMKYGKILPINEEVRRAFIVFASRQWDIYSLGRFGTWRQLLLDDVVQDIRIVERFIKGSEYERDKAVLG